MSAVGTSLEEQRTDAVAAARAPRPDAAPLRHRALLLCALVAAAHAALWAVLTPPLQAPDEPVHIGYAHVVADRGELPAGLTFPSARQLDQRSGGFGHGVDQVYALLPFNVEGSPSWAPGQDVLLDRILAREDADLLASTAAYAANNPPLAYLPVAGAAKVADATGIGTFDRLLALRLVGALWAAVTAACVFLFLRELVPSTPWAWSIGALAVAFHPYVAFVDGGVGPDPLLFALCAALFLLVARALRRGMTPRLGLAFGAVALAGVLTKGTVFGLLPGAALGALLAAARVERTRRREAVLGLGAGAAVFLAGFGAWLWANTNVFERTATTTTGGLVGSGAEAQISVAGQLSYLWQFYLPALPTMTPFLNDVRGFPLWTVWIQGFVGRFGFNQYDFPEHVVWIGVAIALVALALAVRALLGRRATLRRNLVDVGVYLVMLGGLLLLVSVAGYRFQAYTGLSFEQGRYLLPAIALWAALLAVGARGAGPRWGPAVGAFVVTLAVGHSLAAMLMTVERYYL